MKLVVLSDLHAGDAPVGGRHCDLSEVFCLRAVHDLNRRIKPDLVVVPGDLVNEGNSAGAAERYRRLAALFRLIEADTLILPGNHDCEEREFYRYFSRPPAFLDKGGVRFVPFIDPERPGYNAFRDPAGFTLMDRSRTSWKGRIVAVQHVPLFPPGAVPCPFNYTNADAVIAVMRRNGISLSISGHFHAGFDPVRRDGIAYCAAPGLCEGALAFLEIILDGDQDTVVRHTLSLPAELGLWDRHVHTRFAYCNENMDIPQSLRLAKLFQLGGLIFAEHSAHLLFGRDRYLAGIPYAAGGSAAAPAENRVADYLRELGDHAVPRSSTGIELDVDQNGTPVIGPGGAEPFGFVLGAVHRLATLQAAAPDVEQAKKEFLFLTASLVGCNIDALAHPFRVFRRSGVPAPRELYGPLADLLARAGVAAEVNFHTHQPDPAFFRLCVEKGVKLSLGSDAHNLYEVGEFHPHLDFLKNDCGFSGDLRDILL